MDRQIVYGTFRTSWVHLCGGRVEMTARASIDHLPVFGAYATPDEARTVAQASTVDVLVLAIHADLPDGALFEVLQGSQCDRGGRRTVAVMSSFTEALRVAEGRGYMDIGQCRIDLVTGPSVYATAQEFAAARGPVNVPLLSWQRLDAQHFTIDQPAPVIELAHPAASVPETARAA